LFQMKQETETKFKEILKHSLQLVGEAIIANSNVEDPLKFFRAPTFGGVITDPLLLGVITHVRPVAAMYLAFPAGSAEAERGFSQTTLTVTDIRNRIHEETLEDLTLVQDFVSQPYYDFDKLMSSVAHYLRQQNQ